MHRESMNTAAELDKVLADLAGLRGSPAAIKASVVQKQGLDRVLMEIDRRVRSFHGQEFECPCLCLLDSKCGISACSLGLCSPPPPLVTRHNLDKSLRAIAKWRVPRSM